MAQNRSQVRVAGADKFAVQAINKGVNLRYVRALYAVGKTKVYTPPLKFALNGYRGYHISIILCKRRAFSNKIGIHVSVLDPQACLKTPVLQV